jgi:acyl-lipid omega-6 desaturase (Delta-12 desaturase)
MQNPFEGFEANKIVQEFRFSDNSKALLIFLNSFLPYLALLALAFYLSQFSFWYILFLALPTHFFHARMFIIMHDSGHHSFFKQRWANDIAGHICGFFYLIPFLMWRELHNKHHQHQGHLQKRGLSLDVWTLTVREYRSSSRLKKIAYQLYRNPLILFLVAPVLLFVFIFRVPFEKFSSSAIKNIFILDAALLFLLWKFPWVFLGFVAIAGPSLLLSYFMASFLFYVQHQYEHTLWVTEEQSDKTWISLKGSSYVEMPSFLKWCYGNINFHNIHHLDVKIPMYHLPMAYEHLISVKTLPKVTLAEAIKSYQFKLWNPHSGKLEKFTS